MNSPITNGRKLIPAADVCVEYLMVYFKSQMERKCNKAVNACCSVVVL